MNSAYLAIRRIPIEGVRLRPLHSPFRRIAARYREWYEQRHANERDPGSLRRYVEHLYAVRGDLMCDRHYAGCALRGGLLPDGVRYEREQDGVRPYYDDKGGVSDKIFHATANVMTSIMSVGVIQLIGLTLFIYDSIRLAINTHLLRKTERQLERLGETT